MTKIEIILSATLTLSLLFNAGLFVYARQVVSKLIQISGELGDLETMIKSFTNHLDSVYNLETFYGDSTLQGLLNHTKDFSEFVTGMKVNFEIEKEEE